MTKEDRLVRLVDRLARRKRICKITEKVRWLLNVLNLKLHFSQDEKKGKYNV